MTRESPWGAIEVFDAHVHFLSHSFFDKLVAQKPGLTFDAAATQLGWKMPPADPEQLAQTWAMELDRHGVRGAALIGSVPAEESAIAGACRAAPGRFLPFAMVNPRQWDASRASEMRAVCLFPAMHRYSISRRLCAAGIRMGRDVGCGGVPGSALRGAGVSGCGTSSGSSRRSICDFRIP